MPKFRKDKSEQKSALRKTRELLKPIQQDSEEEEETSSNCSEEYSHIPLKTGIPLLTSLSIDDTNETAENETDLTLPVYLPDILFSDIEEEKKDNEESSMDQLIAQIQSLTQSVQALQNQQQQQQQTLNAIADGQAQVSAPQNNQPAPQQPAAAAGIENLFKIPDPIKAIPRFDGNRKQLSAWLTTAENTLMVFKDHVSDCQFSIFTTAILNKIEGKAKDILCLAGNPQNFEEIKEILTNALGDRQELTYYKSQLWQTKMTENMSVHKYYNRCKETVQNIKTLAKQKPKYCKNWDAINAFIEEDALAAFLTGLKEPYFGYAQAAKPEDMEAAYAFVCKFRSRESTAHNLESTKQRFHTRTNKEHKDSNEHENIQGTYRKQYTPRNKPENPEKMIEPPQPMEIGSTRSRLTLNKRQINNNEMQSDSEDERSQYDEDEVAINFCVTGMEEKGT